MHILDDHTVASVQVACSIWSPWRTESQIHIQQIQWSAQDICINTQQIAALLVCTERTPQDITAILAVTKNPKYSKE